MAQTSESPSSRQQSSTSAAHDVEEEVEEIPSNSLMARLTRISEAVASTAIGQYGIKKIDNILWTVENTAKWSLPQNTRMVNPNSPAKEKDSPQKKIQEPPLTRPLPWIFFIPMLIALRTVRAGLSVVCLGLKRNPVTPTMMVNFIQKRRRNLRAIKYAGRRNIRMKYIAAAEERRNGKIVRRNVFSRLGGLINLFMCGRYGEVEEAVKVVAQEKDKTNERKKRQADDNDELGCSELLDKLANEDDSDDSSFASETLVSSDITISDDESETDNILNKTMNEKDTPKYATSKKRKSRSHPNSGSSAQASEPTNVEAFQHMSTPKRSQSHTIVSDNGPDDTKMKNGENGHTANEEIKKSPVKGGSSKETENSENVESINNLPESQRNEVISSSPPKTNQSPNKQ